MTWGEILLALRVGQAGKARQGSAYSLLKDVGGPVGGQRSTPSAGEQDPVATIATLGNPGPQRAGSSGPQWDTAFLAALALEVKQRGPSESEVVLTESENLRDAGSGIIERQQQGVITLPDPRLSAWRGENGIHFQPCQIADQAAVRAFGGNRQCL